MRRDFWNKQKHALMLKYESFRVWLDYLYSLLSLKNSTKGSMIWTVLVISIAIMIFVVLFIKLKQMNAGATSEILP